VEHAFGRIKIISGNVVTVTDEPFVFKAVKNFFVATDPYFKKELRRRMSQSTASDQGGLFERFMMDVFSETFNTRPLSEWPRQPPISELCASLVGKVETVGWREPGLGQIMTPSMMSMEDFMGAHVNRKINSQQYACRVIFLPEVQVVGSRQSFSSGSTSLEIKL
jgi:hypothetical protein